MIFCVVLGHCLELINGNISKLLYIFIYTFHMPIFVFISGYFAKFDLKKIIKFTGIYLIWQTIYCLFDKFILNISTNIQYVTPNWVLWYVMAIAIWNLLIKVFDTNSKKKAIFIIIFAFMISIIVGFVDSIGYWLSLSRIIVFLPYFLLGYYTKKFGFNFLDMKDKNNKLNKMKITMIIILLSVTLIYLGGIRDIIEARWLYGSYSYNKANYNYIVRIVLIILSLSELIIFYNVTPNKNMNMISKIGANTLTIYLLHGLVIKIFKIRKSIFVYEEHVNIIIAIATSIIMLIFLGICVPKVLSEIKKKKLEL